MRILRKFLMALGVIVPVTLSVLMVLSILGPPGIAVPLRYHINNILYPDSKPPPQVKATKRLLPLPAVAPNMDAKLLNGTAADPVSLDPCRVTNFVLNPDYTDPKTVNTIKKALNTFSEASGFAVNFAGTTDEPLNPDRPAYQPQRYGKVWAPVLIGFAKENMAVSGRKVITATDLGAAAGFPAVSPDGMAYTSGIVLLNTEVLQGPNSRLYATLLHELAHVAGLDHTSDSDSLMAPVDSGRDSYSKEDLASLATVARARCHPEL